MLLTVLLLVVRDMRNVMVFIIVVELQIQNMKIVIIKMNVLVIRIIKDVRVNQKLLR